MPYTSKACRYLKVEAALREQLQAWLTAAISFVIETNAASERDYVLFRALRKAGYRLELRYVGLESVVVCQQRIAQRVREGGHDVPPALVQQRYTNGLSLLKQYYRLFDRLQLYDNSGTEARQVADLLPGGPPCCKWLIHPRGRSPCFSTLPAWRSCIKKQPVALDTHPTRRGARCYPRLRLPPLLRAAPVAGPAAPARRGPAAMAA